MADRFSVKPIGGAVVVVLVVWVGGWNEAGGAPEGRVNLVVPL